MKTGVCDLLNSLRLISNKMSIENQFVNKYRFYSLRSVVKLKLKMS